MKTKNKKSDPRPFKLFKRRLDKITSGWEFVKQVEVQLDDPEVLLRLIDVMIAIDGLIKLHNNFPKNQNPCFVNCCMFLCYKYVNQFGLKT